MKIIIIVALLLCIGNLYIRNRILNTELVNKNKHYRSNLSRDEMKQALYDAINDSISLMIPADTSVMPYLIKRPVKNLEGEYVSR